MRSFASSHPSPACAGRACWPGHGLWSAAQAQPAPAWPTRTVKILVGFPGGSTPDIAARVLAESP
jgi:tripartite-type tricarboxylate transporter receptor subunit TctC